jgi:hypothetical protein
MTLCAGLALLVLAVGLVLSGSPVRVLGTNSVREGGTAFAMRGGEGACQGNETLPRGTSALRLGLEARVGPKITLAVFSRGGVLARATRGSGWTGGDVTVPIAQVPRAISSARICFTLGPTREFVLRLGRELRARNAHGVPSLRMRIEYLAPGEATWWASALSVARRIGLGRAPSGTWVALLLVALMAIVATLASYLCVRNLGAPGATTSTSVRARRSWLADMPRRLPTAAWVCALIAFINAACWAILSPPFQAPDEPAHFAYVQQLAVSHALPRNDGQLYSVEEERALADLHQSHVQFRPGAQVISTGAQERKLEHELGEPLSTKGTGNAGTAANEPPLYYALETIPYELGSSGSLLDRLELMRLLSALFGGLTALFAFMFAREGLPAVPWAWTVGGLGVALAPLLGFMSGVVNPDALLCAVSAALFYLLARAFRRGLTYRLIAAICMTMTAGVFTQLTFLGLVPGAAVGLISVALRAPSSSRRRGYSALALALLSCLALLYLLFSSTTDHRSLSVVSGLASAVGRKGSVSGELSYIWQFYLPRLPGINDYFPGIFTTRQIWFDGLVGLYGWAETVFPGWVDNLALLPAALVGVLCLRALIAGRAALRRRILELLVYLTMGIGVLAVVGIASYDNNVLGVLGPYSEPRYLLPMLALFGAVLALAARGAGRRWGPVVGTAIVVLILAHDVFSQLLVVSRYYS